MNGSQTLAGAKRPRFPHLAACAAVVGLALATLAQHADAKAGNWPPPPGSDPLDPANWPNDPGFAQWVRTDSACTAGATPVCSVRGTGQLTCVAGKWTETLCGAGQVCQYVGTGSATEQKCAPGTGPKMFITDGEWNNFSFMPEPWTRTKGFRDVERTIGSGMHTNDAWSTTIGDRRVIIAVIDSGINWNSDDQVNKYYLNKGELTPPEAACHQAGYNPADPWDSNGDGIFTMADFAKEAPRDVPKTSCDSRVTDKNSNGMLDPQDLIKSSFSDGKDTDGNGYVDDISGWDFYRNDNDPYDDTHYGHGTGEARDSSAEGNNNRGSLGICPECTTLMVRGGDSFVADGNDFAGGVFFAVDSGASVIQSALGSLSRSLYAEDAITYAYNNNVVFIASAADELSFHHNAPSTTNHSLYVHAIVYDGPSSKNSTTFLNFNNCTNFGGNLFLSSPGTGCSSEATGVTAGHSGMVYSAALQAGLNPPISAEEVRGVLLVTADDIDVPESATDTTKFPSGPGWDLHFGYGRNNVAASVKMVAAQLIPPETDITHPLWFEPIEVTRTPKVTIKGSVGKRADGLPSRYAKYDYVLEVAKGIDPKGSEGWKTIKEEKGIDAKSGDLAEWDVAESSKLVNYDAPLADHDQYSFTLRLRVSSKTSGGAEVKSEYRKSVSLYKDPDLLPGFPINNLASIEASGKMFDLDGDGKDEYIVPSSDGKLHAYKADASEPKGWPVWSPVRKEFDPTYLYNTTNSCAYRAKKDGCLRKNGTFKPEYHSVMTGTPAIGDLDGDGKIEVVQTTYDGHVFVVGADGAARAGFPVEVDRERSKKADEQHLWDDGIFSAASLGDLDGDKKLEIVVGAMDGQLYVWHDDGKLAKGFPLEINDKTKGDLGDRIITTPSLGDIDNDGKLDIAVGTNEVFGADKAKNEARGYVLHGDGTLFKGFPVTTFGIQAYVLPSVGSGVPGNATLVDLDGDKKLEVNFDTIGSAGTFFTSEGKTFCIGKAAGKCSSTFSNNAKNFGPKTNTKEKTAAFVLISNGAVGHVDPGGGIDFIKASAGFDFALTFASGGQRAEFDHLIGAYDSVTGKMLEGWPRVIDDWQFFSNPSIVDIDHDNHPEVIAGSAGYLVHAWNYLGVEPPGFPHFTMGWLLASPAMGDMDGDGKFDLAIGSRDGWIFAWKTRSGTIDGAINEWPMHGHDLHNTDNYHAVINPYAKKVEVDAGSTDTTGGDDAISGQDAGGDTSTPESTPAPADSGCTAASRSSTAGGWLVAMALAALALRRRSVA